MVEKITKWLYLEPLLFKDFVHLAEISKQIGKNHSVVRQYLNYFEKQRAVVKKIVGKMTMYKMNIDYSLIVEVISLIEKERLIINAQNLVLKEFVKEVHDKIVNSALIFGSFVDNPKEARDIDLLVVGKVDKAKVRETENKLNKRIHLINVNSLTDVSDALKEEIKKRHLIVNGVESIVRWLI